MAVVMAVLVPLVVVVGPVFQQLHPHRAVDNRRTGALQGVLQKFLQPRAVDGDHVRPFQLLHVLHGQGVVVEAAGAPGVQPLHLHSLHPLGHGGGEQINGVGGTHHRQPGLLRRDRAAGERQEQRGQEGKQNRSFHWVYSSRFVQYIAIYGICKVGPLLQ